MGQFSKIIEFFFKIFYQAMKERMNNLASSLGMPPGLSEGLKWSF